MTRWRPVRDSVRRGGTARMLAVALGLVCVSSVVLGSVAFAWSEPSEVESEELLVADLRAAALLVVDVGTGEVRRSIPMPGGPHEMQRLPDGRVVVSIEQSGQLAVVDVEKSSVEVVDTRGVPHGLALDHLDGDVLLVTDRAVDQIRRFRIGSWEELAPLPAGGWPHAVGMTSTGEVVVANAGSGTLQVGARAYETGPVTETVSVSRDGRIATASAWQGTVWVFDPLEGSPSQLELGGRPVRVSFSPDEQVLAVALSATGAVGLIRDGEVRLVTVSGVPDGLEFSWDGSRVYVSDVYGGALTVVDVAEARVLRVHSLGQATGTILRLSR